MHAVMVEQLADFVHRALLKCGSMTGGDRRDLVLRCLNQVGMEPYGGCLCIGCLEQRIGRQLMPDDFPNHALNTLPGTPKLMDRRGIPYDVLGNFPEELRSKKTSVKS
jgi:hypothetical protein